MDLTVTLPGNKKVDATYKGFTIHTDQAKYAGGDESAPAPFDLFLASIGTCGGVYVVYFCEKRGIPFENIRLIQRMEKDPETKMIKKISLDIELPPDFPEKYKEGLIRAVDLCTVKRHIKDAPEFEIKTVTAE
jgi:putative redox protein